MNVVAVLKDMEGGNGGWGVKIGDLVKPRKIKALLMGEGRGVEHQKWPYWFVVCHMALGLTAYPARILATDTLVDCSTLHMYTLVTMGLMWTFFFLTSRTDPGVIDRKSKDGELRKLAERMGEQYDEVLEGLGRETTNDGQVAMAGVKHPPLCHTCHIVKPTRSKHCRVKRKCTLIFDHYCPFVSNGVGMCNYKYFFLYILFHCLSQVGFMVTVFKYLGRNGWDWFMGTVGLYVCLFVLPGLMMLSYHTQLIHKNLTTNEHSNLFRYKYLHDGNGRYRNPFDQGFMANLYDRMMPSVTSYQVGGGREGEKDELLGNIV